MLRRYPLSWLFVLASVLVDIVLTVVGTRYSISQRAVLTGLLLGQTGALSIWAASGRGHRLGRVSIMVITTCAVAWATGAHALGSRFQWLAILAGYTWLVYLGAVLIVLCRIYSVRRSAPADPGPTWQISLIELFGWTILVAIASFIARSMDFSFLRPQDHGPEKVIALVAAPLLLNLSVRWDLRDLKFSSASWILMGIVAAGALLQWREPRWGGLVVATQAGYLVLWYLVLGLDHVTTETQAEQRKKLSDEAHSAPVESGSDHRET